MSLDNCNDQMQLQEPLDGGPRITRLSTCTSVQHPDELDKCFIGVLLIQANKINKSVWAGEQWQAYHGMPAAGSRVLVRQLFRRRDRARNVRRPVKYRRPPCHMYAPQPQEVSM